MRHCMVHPPKPDLELVFFFACNFFIKKITFGLIAFDSPIRFDYNLKPQKNVVEYCYRQSNQHSEYNSAKNKYEVKI